MGLSLAIDVSILLKFLLTSVASLRKMSVDRFNVQLQRPTSVDDDPELLEAWNQQVKLSEEQALAYWSLHPRAEWIEVAYRRGRLTLTILHVNLWKDWRPAYFLTPERYPLELGWSLRLLNYYHIPWPVNQMTFLLGVMVEAKRHPDFEEEVNRQKALQDRHVRVVLHDNLFYVQAILHVAFRAGLLPVSMVNEYQVCIDNPDLCCHHGKIHKSVI